VVDGIQKIMPGRPARPVPLSDSGAAPGRPGMSR